MLPEHIIRLFVAKNVKIIFAIFHNIKNLNIYFSNQLGKRCEQLRRSDLPRNGRGESEHQTRIDKIRKAVSCLYTVLGILIFRIMPYYLRRKAWALY
jgi:hypothetical protein